ncbi:MAG: DUF1330 domain-containing protein [Desulfobacterales bacterium]|nr:DUF1330 domain-containing protein [Desulfobacterales bacterium]MBS3755557.1 DUF1330 domain-containing protein [Desulfobacterales bacterium]
MPSLLPTEEQFQNIHTVSDQGELVMVNLLCFKPEGGEALYEKYSQLIYPILKRIGARVIYYGSGVMTFIGDEYWDAVLLVEYPSRSVFVQMVQDPEYLRASKYREEGLIDSRLYVTRPQWMG